MAEEFVKPRPPAKAMSLHELRSAVKANDKFAVARQGVEEAVKLIMETYRCDENSARIFVEYIKGNGTDTSGPYAPKASPLERLRKGCDPETGKETYLDPDEKPESKGKKKK